MSPDCLFCKIAGGEIAADVVAQDDQYVAFRDINPQAPTHILVIPRKHLPSLDRAGPDDRALLGGALLYAQEVARAEGVAEAGYRVVINTNKQAQQSVFHLHVHILGGRAMQWPPG